MGDEHREPSPYGDSRQLRLHGYDVTLSGELGARLEALDADPRWLTTWWQQGERDRCVDRPAPCPVLAEPPRTGQFEHGWKFAAVQRLSQEFRPFVWVDDLAITSAARRWADTVCPVRTLLLAPDSAVGLTHIEMDAIEEFVDSVHDPELP